MPTVILRKVQTTRRTIGAIARLSDPDYDKDRTWSVEYDFTTPMGGERKFYGNPNIRGIFTPPTEEE